jgi:hypothetical protein
VVGKAQGCRFHLCKRPIRFYFILFYNSCDIWWVSRFYANLMILDCSYGCIMVIMGRNRIEEINKGCHIYFVSKSSSQGFS